MLTCKCMRVYLYPPFWLTFNYLHFYNPTVDWFIICYFFSGLRIRIHINWSIQLLYQVFWIRILRFRIPHYQKKLESSLIFYHYLEQRKRWKSTICEDVFTYFFFQKTWIRMHIGILNTDPDPATKMNTDPFWIRIRFRIRNPGFSVTPMDGSFIVSFSGLPMRKRRRETDSTSSRTTAKPFKNIQKPLVRKYPILKNHRLLCKISHIFLVYLASLKVGSWYQMPFKVGSGKPC